MMGPHLVTGTPTGTLTLLLRGSHAQILEEDRVRLQQTPNYVEHVVRSPVTVWTLPSWLPSTWMESLDKAMRPSGCETGEAVAGVTQSCTAISAL